MDKNSPRHKELGDFLKTRRARLLPAQAGLPEGSRRRTPGLRREEVASLAGIGLTWYTWLEQGRSIQVSAQVLTSLARVLRLDKQETLHLFTLAQQAPPHSLPLQEAAVNPMLQHVLDRLHLSPATILDRRWNIMAWNEAATAIFLDYSQISLRERNSVRIMFTNQEYRQRFADWEYHARGMLARFRASCGQFIDDPWIAGFVDELRRESREFDLWWPMHNVEPEQELTKTCRHPLVGDLFFEHTSFTVADNASLKMNVNTPLPGSGTEEKIQRLLDAGKKAGSGTPVNIEP